MGILVALIERNKSGKGQVVDANLVSKCAKKKKEMSVNNTTVDSRYILSKHIPILDAKVWPRLGR